MRVRASLMEDLELEIYEANGDLKRQIQHIENMIHNGTDIIIVSPLYAGELDHSIDKAEKAGIPVIVIDRKINSDSYTAYMGADNIEVGRIAANFIANSARGPARVLELSGGDGSSAAEERSLGFHQVLDELPEIDVFSIRGDENGMPANKVQKALDSLENQVDFVFGFNDAMAMTAWEEARKRGIEEHIDFIGVDGLSGPNGGIEQVLQGELSATILYPTGGNEVITLARQLARTGSVPRRNFLSTTLIDEFNAEIMKDQLEKIQGQQEEIEQQVTAIEKQEELYYAQNNLLKVAVTLLIIVLSLSIYSVYSIFTIRQKNKQLMMNNQKITIQRNQIEKIAEEVRASNEAKVNFFTGLSHEFKTPITLIMSSIESLRDRLNGGSQAYQQELNLINNNSNRLLRLINNLLDFRKIEDQKFNLRASKTNLYQFSEALLQEFKREAQRRSIHLELHSNNPQLDVFIDRNLMDKVYFNLLSNAFKFTPDGGKISLTIKDLHPTNRVQITFQDSGIGIPQEELNQVFEPFFKGSNNRKNSSGIGLHLSKQFIDLHLGKINVSSEEGTIFTIELFKGDTHFNEDQIVESMEMKQSQTLEDSWELEEAESTEPIESSNTSLKNKEEIIQEQSTEEELPSVLIIEDNVDLSNFLKSKLERTYHVHVSDGTDGIEKAFAYIPDLIICDVNLPEKDGFEICQTLKNDMRTSHIPTIILTALGDEESYLKGLQSGADLYLTKPFSYSILTQSLKTLLYNRERLRAHFSQLVPQQESQITNVDQLFILKLNKEIESHLDHADYKVESLAEAMGISRVQLYRKVKAILGISISDHLNSFRLEKSKELLISTNLSISEIAYSCGFSSPNYFSTSFKSKFDHSPVQFRKTASKASQS